MSFDFIKPTIIFAIVGFFIPGFTAIGLLGIQMLLSYIGIECSFAWLLIWVITTVVGLILPFLFYRYIKLLKAGEGHLLKTILIVFNLLEYVCIQSSLTPLFTNGRTLCYGGGGENGLELCFTAWLSLPILIAFSFVFNRLFKKVNMV